MSDPKRQPGRQVAGERRTFPIKSGKQWRAELDARRKQRAAKIGAKRAEKEQAARVRNAGGVPVNRDALAKNNSYGEPDFAARGYYLDRPFKCVDCGKSEVWTATQQKWWYEVAKGYAYSLANRCRACRRRERERRAEARQAHLDGLAREFAEESSTPLSDRDRDRDRDCFLNLLAKPPAPTTALRRAAERHKTRKS